MLIEYYGKLPHKAEFISSSESSPMIQALIAWIERGQDHLGEPILRTHEHRLHAYFFTIYKPMLTATVTGIFFKSCDRRSRTYPFIVFHRHIEDGADIVSDYGDLFDKIGFEISVLDQTLDNMLLLQEYSNFFRQSIQVREGTVWQNITNKQLLVSNNLTSILYRKLMMGNLS